MARREFTKATKRQCTCAQCGASFERGYAISEARAARPQFCSRQCQSQFAQAVASDRLNDRFWSRVTMGNETACWPWAGRRNSNGYGVFDWNNRPYIASRIAYLLSTGADPDDRFVCHSCDNRLCCNPSHIWLGTHRDNMRDMALKGRAHVTGWKGEGHPSSRLLQEQVLKIRASNLPGSVLAEQYEVTAAAIYNIRERKTWRHI